MAINGNCVIIAEVTAYDLLAYVELNLTTFVLQLSIYDNIITCQY